MAPRLVDLYRQHGPAVFARCRKLLGEDDAAIAATTDTFARRARDRRVDARLLGETAETVCLERMPPGRLAILEGADIDPSAEERFRRLYLARGLPAIERAERPPFVLRWIWIFAPVFVSFAATGMFLAARSANRLDAEADRVAGLEVYAEKDENTYRVAPGSRLHHGQSVRLVVVPAGAAYATIADVGTGRVLAVLGPLAKTDHRVELPAPLDIAPGHLRLVGFLSTKPLPPATVQIAVAQRALGKTAADLPAVEVSFDAEVE